METNHYDLVIIDEKLPGSTEWEILDRLRRRNSTVPVLMLTKCREYQAGQAKHRYHPDAYLTRRFEVNDLLQEMRRLMSHRN